ncbi:MAG: hypothetical protein PUC06_03605 [Oscillospiraceae bacterium]|nr:hypothetical protein [Oscillospiraceae bacterium]
MRDNNKYIHPPRFVGGVPDAPLVRITMTRKRQKLLGEGAVSRKAD